MIRSCIAAFLLIATMSAQNAQVPKVRIFFTEGHFERAAITYGIRWPDGHYSRTFGTSMPSGDSFFEIAAATDRFMALVWAPGCKMKEFDVPVGNSDIELRFSCDPLKTVTFLGRVKSVNIGGATTISANYMAFGTCVWMDAPTDLSVIHCGGPQIVGIGIADVATDGTFKMELPDFSSDPVVSGDSTAEIEFRLNNTTLLRLESSEGSWFGIAASYPARVTFVPVEWETPPRKSH